MTLRATLRHVNGGHDMATSTRRLVPQTALGRAQPSCLRVPQPWQPPSRPTIQHSTSPSTTSDLVPPSHCQLHQRSDSCNLSIGGSGSVMERSACAVASAASSHVRRGKSRRTDLLCAQWSMPHVERSLCYVTDVTDVTDKLTARPHRGLMPAVPPGQWEPLVGACGAIE